MVLWLRRLCAVLVLFLLLPLGCAVNPATGRNELALFAVPASEEIALGQKAFPQAVQKMGGEYNDSQLASYINTVGRRLGQYSQRPELPYQFKVVNDSSPNAFALPGGFIAISRGLLVNLENEAQLAAVLGHEVGHVEARHSVQGMQRGTLLGLGVAVLSGATGNTAYGPLAEQAGQLAAGLVDKSYSRDQERESDRLGIDTMVKAGYNPKGAVQLQDFFYRQMEGGAEPMWLTGLFRTHPFSKERLQDAQAYIQSRYPVQASNDLGLKAEPFLQATARVKSTRAGFEAYDRAWDLEAKGDAAGAIAAYLRAAQLAPGESLILTGLGTAYLKAGDFPSARMHLARAVQLDGNYFQSRMGLGYAYLEQGAANQAVPELEASMKLLPTVQGAYLLAEAYEKTGQRQQALELYRAVAQADPSGKLGQAAAARVKALGG